MMRYVPSRVLVASVLFTLAAIACSSNGDGSGGFPYSGPSCAGTSAFTTACWSCMQSHCSALSSCITNGCSTFYQCYCACGGNDSACRVGCESEAASDCQSCMMQSSNTCSQCDATCNPSGYSGLPTVGAAPQPDGFIAAALGGGGGACNIPSPDTQWLSVGSATSGKPATVVNGGSTGVGTASIHCMVHQASFGFDIDLSVSVAGTPGGSVTISSPSGQGAVTTLGATGITASFSRGTMGPYSSSDCTLTFTYEGQPVPVSPAVAGGRIWGHVDCPDATVAGQMTTGPDGGPTEVGCPASADFLFEQCNE